ncbi:MAG: hypothetical protein AAF938_03180, partial [Myxococcota bacterium]
MLRTIERATGWRARRAVTRGVFAGLVLLLACGDAVDPGDGSLDAASCVDGVQNGDETDVDCGGTCRACDIGLRCAMNADCESLVCMEDRCTESTAQARCDDGAQNGDETGVDCGGTCRGCANGEACA